MTSNLSGTSERVRIAARAQGVDIKKLAARAGIPYRTLQDNLAARRRWAASTVLAVARALGVSCDYLIHGEAASMDAAALWSALDRLMSRMACPEPVTEELVASFYYEYTWQYLLRLSPPGGVYPNMDHAEASTKTFIERMAADTGPAMTAMRRKASGAWDAEGPPEIPPEIPPVRSWESHRNEESMT